MNTLTPLGFLFAAVLAFLASPARAAQSFDACTGFIDALPAVIATPGTWCLRKDLATGIASGGAIEVKANNVTVDCNGFKIGGLSTPIDGNADGIRSWDHANTTVRHCNIRGFRLGIYMANSGHVLHDNRIEGSFGSGILVDWAGLATGLTVVRDNLVLDVGKAGTSVSGIYVSGDAFIIGNTVSGVSATQSAWGIHVNITGSGAITGNTVRNVVSGDGANAFGILLVTEGRFAISQNDVATTPGAAGAALRCAYPGSQAKGNLSSGFTLAIDGCENAGGNHHQP